MKAAKLAAKKGKSSVGAVATSNAPAVSETVGAGALNLAPAIKKMVKTEPVTSSLFPIASALTTNYSILDPTALLWRPSELESSADYILKFASFESNLAEASLRKKRFSSFLEFVDGINVNQEENANMQKPAQQNDDLPKDFGERKARNNSILSFLENDFFGESVSTKDNVKEPSFLESLDNNLKLFGDTIDSTKSQETARLIKSRMDSGLFFEKDTSQLQSRRNSSFLFF